MALSAVYPVCLRPGGITTKPGTSSPCEDGLKGPGTRAHGGTGHGAESVVDRPPLGDAKRHRRARHATAWALLAGQGTRAIWPELLTLYTEKFIRSYHDRHPDLSIVQQSFLFPLYALGALDVPPVFPPSALRRLGKQGAVADHASLPVHARSAPCPDAGSGQPARLSGQSPPETDRAIAS
jgi:hypothetical protein